MLESIFRTNRNHYIEQLSPNDAATTYLEGGLCLQSDAGCMADINRYPMPASVFVWKVSHQLFRNNPHF